MQAVAGRASSGQRRPNDLGDHWRERERDMSKYTVKAGLDEFDVEASEYSIIEGIVTFITNADNGNPPVASFQAGKWDHIEREGAVTARPKHATSNLGSLSRQI